MFAAAVATGDGTAVVSQRQEDSGRDSRWSSLPIVVDLDGTLTATDTLHESIVALVRQSPWQALRMPTWLMSGRAQFKSRVAQASRFDPGDLPWRQDLLAWLQEQHAMGRPLVLATAADRLIADGVAKALPLFGKVLASDEGHNLKGANKLKKIREQVGDAFVYAGDSAADLPIWQAASAAIPVGASRQTRQALARLETPIEREFDAPRTPRFATWVRALRLHQWVKNLLVFVPLLVSFLFVEWSKCVAAALAFVSFGLAASATYLWNDLWDLRADRMHPRKRERPLAAARISIPSALLASGVLLVAGLLLALLASPAFMGMLLAYVVMTTTYSWVFKRYVLMDVLMLAMLYTMRVLAGAVAIGVDTSPWLLAFSVFVFFSLALVKRCAELVVLRDAGKSGSKGRDYQVNDLVVLWPLGIGAGVASVVVFGLYVGSPVAQQNFGDGKLLWLAGVGLLYWLGRLWIKTARGEMHDDPIVYALKDHGSRVAVMGMVVTTVAAYALRH